MKSDMGMSHIDLGRVGKLGGKPSKEGLLEWLSLKEEFVNSIPLPTYTREKLLFLINSLKLKVNRHWEKMLAGGESGVEEDFRYLNALLADPLREYARKSPGTTEEERRLRALVQWIEEELSIPGDRQLDYILEKIGNIKSDIGSLEGKERELFADQFRHSSGRLAKRIDARIVRLNEIKRALER